MEFWTSLAEAIDAWWKVLGILGILAVLAWNYVVRPCRRGLRIVAATFTQYEGFAVTMGQLQGVSEKVDVMSRALGPNGGASLADKIDETRDTVLVVASQVKEIWDMTERPLWLADEHGQGTRVNRAFEQTFGYPVGELIGSGWLQHVADQDRDRVTREFQLAFKERRAFRSYCSYVTSAGVELHVVIRGEPIIDGKSGSRVVAMRGAVEIVHVKGAA